MRKKNKNNIKQQEVERTHFWQMHQHFKLSSQFSIVTVRHVKSPTVTNLKSSHHSLRSGRRTWGYGTGPPTWRDIWTCSSDQTASQTMMKSAYWPTETSVQGAKFSKIQTWHHHRPRAVDLPRFNEILPPGSSKPAGGSLKPEEDLDVGSYKICKVKSTAKPHPPPKAIKELKPS